MPLTPADDQRHEPDGVDPLWRESWGFYFVDPRRNLCCRARLSVAAEAPGCSLSVCLSSDGRPLYHRQRDGLQVPPGDVLAGIEAGGLSFRALSLARGRYLVGFSDPASRFSFDFDWRGLHEPADGAGMQGQAGGGLFLEQLGHVVGRMTFGDDSVDVFGVGPRDHVVGNVEACFGAGHDRVLVMMDDGRAFGLRQLQARDGAKQSSWMWDREKLLPLSGIRFEKTLDAEQRPVAVDVRFADSAGGRYLLNGLRRTSMDAYADDRATCSGYFDFTLDDGTRGHGVLEHAYRMNEGWQGSAGVVRMRW